MATGIASPDSGRSPKPPAGKGQGKAVDYGEFIDGQLRRTRGQVKATEIAMGLMSLLVAALAFLLVAILVDHWLIHGGLGVAHRVVLFSVLVIGAVYYLATTVLPALLKRVNPVYAAHTIERSKPSLKNSLINFLLLRQQPEAVPQVVYSAAGQASGHRTFEDARRFGRRSHAADPDGLRPDRLRRRVCALRNLLS